MHQRFDSIGLIGKPSPSISDTLTQIYKHLIGRNFQVLVETHSSQYITCESVETSEIREIGKHCGLAVTVGGDGTLLSAGRNLAPFNVPVVGVNLGRLGFLVDISPEEVLARLDDILAGHFVTEERIILKARLIRDGRVIHEQSAVNEVVIHRWISPSMIEIVTHIDQVFLNSQRSDGLIVSTPTGSTAYALSGGGPILHPALGCIVLVPINPHTLTNRPIVVNDSSVVEIGFSQTAEINAQVTCDDISIPDVLISDRIQIVKDEHLLRILHPMDYDFFNILRAKLNWSS
ncbi:MAG: NAD(+) kinase [Methylococcaceae bacterium]|nr:NAD(+) kinase [Methylococcaceae bacterium]